MRSASRILHAREHPRLPQHLDRQRRGAELDLAVLELEPLRRARQERIGRACALGKLRERIQGAEPHRRALVSGQLTEPVPRLLLVPLLARAGDPTVGRRHRQEHARGIRRRVFAREVREQLGDFARTARLAAVYMGELHPKRRRER
ncbi:MAG: hypothetical protein QM769_11240 [Pseudoxanthomonas sp.]